MNFERFCTNYYLQCEERNLHFEIYCDFSNLNHSIDVDVLNTKILIFYMFSS